MHNKPMQGGVGAKSSGVGRTARHLQGWKKHDEMFIVAGVQALRGRQYSGQMDTKVGVTEKHLWCGGV